VCIVADGRKNVDPRVLDCLASLGCYQEGAMTNSVKGEAVTAHLFEYTTSFALNGDLHFKYPDKGICPTQIILCIKEKNVSRLRVALTARPKRSIRIAGSSTRSHHYSR
jgi:chitin synthase